MLKPKKTSWLVVLAGLIAVPAFAQEKAFTENSARVFGTNVTLTSANVPVLLRGDVGSVNVRHIEVPANQAARIYVYLSDASTLSSTVTNDVTNFKGCILLGGTNITGNTEGRFNATFSRTAPLGLWKGRIVISSPDGTGTVSYVELR